MKFEGLCLLGLLGLAIGFAPFEKTIVDVNTFTGSNELPYAKAVSDFTFYIFIFMCVSHQNLYDNFLDVQSEKKSTFIRK